MDNVTATAAVSSVVSAGSHEFIETAKAWITYAGVLIGAVIAAYAGIRKALKDLKGDGTPGGNVASPEVKRIVGGAILDSTTMLMWAESNQAVVEAIEKLVHKVESSVNSVNYNTEAQRDVCSDIVELRHQIERLRDKMP